MCVCGKLTFSLSREDGKRTKGSTSDYQLTWISSIEEKEWERQSVSQSVNHIHITVRDLRYGFQGTGSLKTIPFLSSKYILIDHHTFHRTSLLFSIELSHNRVWFSSGDFHPNTWSFSICLEPWRVVTHFISALLIQHSKLVLENDSFCLSLMLKDKTDERVPRLYHETPFLYYSL